jgi:hypothetical protein
VTISPLQNTTPSECVSDQTVVCLYQETQL